MANSSRFSPSAAWDQVRLWLNRHLQSIIALAGVFFLLPSLVLAFFGPVMVAPTFDASGASPEVIIAQFQEAIRPLIPWIIALSIIQMVGQLAIMMVASTNNGATVGEAIGVAFGRLGYLILVQIVLGLLTGAVLMLLGLFVGLAGALIPALGIILAAAMLALLVYLMIRLSLVSAVLVAEDARWPFALLRRSWELTGGHAGMIFLFYLIVAILFMIISVVIGLVFGLVLNLAGPAGVSILEVINSMVSAAGAAIFALMPLAVWSQLSGGTTPEVFS